MGMPPAWLATQKFVIRRFFLSLFQLLVQWFDHSIRRLSHIYTRVWHAQNGRGWVGFALFSIRNWGSSEEQLYACSLLDILGKYLRSMVLHERIGVENFAFRESRLLGGGWGGWDFKLDYRLWLDKDTNVMIIFEGDL
jgi:hypothetical protein